ncbi:hypothetical protein [Microbacterium sp. USHLN272]|uniref:hypothetical protein n=1 Tax=Microbacterium sp. USHLN272 TaxID=3081287 RepID=UPI003016726F
MSAAQPVVISGVTDSGMRYAHLWHPEFKVVGAPGPYHMAGMTTERALMFSIDSACPTPWIDIALRMFDTFRRGELPTPTHTVEWKFGRPTFSPVTAPEQDDEAALFDMEGTDR